MGASIASIFPYLAPGAPKDKRQATPELEKEPFATSKGLYCQHLPPILAQGPPRKGAKPALTRADALILAFLGPTGPPAPTAQSTPPIFWPGLTPLLGPSWRHMGAWPPSIFNRGPGSNRASVALAWVDPPSGPILAPWRASIASILPLSCDRGPRAMEPNLPLPRLTPLSFVFASIFPLYWPRGPRAMGPNLPLPGLIPLILGLSWALGRLYCQHLPPILAQGPPRNGAKPALTRAYPVWAGASRQALLSKAPGSLPHGGPVAAKVWFRLGRGPFWAHPGAIWGHGLLLSSTGAPGATEPQLHWPGLTPLLGPSWRHGAPLLPASSPYLATGAPAQWSQTCPYQG